MRGSEDQTASTSEPDVSSVMGQIYTEIPHSDRDKRIKEGVEQFCLGCATHRPSTGHRGSLNAFFWRTVYIGFDAGSDNSDPSFFNSDYGTFGELGPYDDSMIFAIAGFRTIN